MSFEVDCICIVPSSGFSSPFKNTEVATVLVRTTSISLPLFLSTSVEAHGTKVITEPGSPCGSSFAGDMTINVHKVK